MARYQDTGCELHNSCLNCPEPDCIRGSVAYLYGVIRAKGIVRLQSEGKTVGALASEFHVSHRTIQRALKKGKRGKEDVSIRG